MIRIIFLWYSMTKNNIPKTVNIECIFYEFIRYISRIKKYLEIFPSNIFTICFAPNCMFVYIVKFDVPWIVLGVVCQKIRVRDCFWVMFIGGGQNCANKRFCYIEFSSYNSLQMLLGFCEFNIYLKPFFHCLKNVWQIYFIIRKKNNISYILIYFSMCTKSFSVLMK